MRKSLSLRLLAGLLVLTAGCAHRRLPRTPTPADIAEINDVAAKDPAGIRVVYLDPNPCGPGACTVESARPVFDGPPSSIRRILSADGQHLSVVTDSGEVWHLDLSKVAGMTTQPPNPARGALAGGVFGLGAGGLAALMIGFFSVPGPDVNAPDNGQGHPAPTTAMVGALVVGTLLGAVLGVAIDHHSPSLETFDFGGDHGFDAGALSR